MLHYDELELEVVRFAAEDVIATSGEQECTPDDQTDPDECREVVTK